MTQAVEEKKEVKIGSYSLSGKIGQGGIAEIYKGKQESLDREVAIKILFSDLCSDNELVRRFERESVVIAKLNHPNIVHVIDKGVAGGRYYFVMEYIDGTSLREVIDSEKINLTTKIEMIGQVCKALDYAHKNGVIHRDIKPANILIDKQGNARVADFGIAQIVGTPETEMTSSDVIMGTLSYMSPEQKVSSTNVDNTTDIYAIGVILYEILLNKKPLGRFKLPSEIDPNIDCRFDEIIKKCLAQEAKDRYQTAVELKNDLLDVVTVTNSSIEERVPSVNVSESFIGKCRHLDTIRETRFSSTMLVENRSNNKLYVIKTHQKGEVGQKEAKLLESLKHKNILAILGSGGDLKKTIVISEYAQGGSLAERMVRKYEWEKALNITLDVATGLEFAHRNNIIHGNLRPSNILFTADEEIRISDFGLPSHYDAGGKKNWYNAPEHKKSKVADIYALGVILHQLVTGRNPQYDSGGNLILTELIQIVPDDFISILRKLLAIRVSQRYQTCKELLLDWEDHEQRVQNAKNMIKDDSRKPIEIQTNANKKIIIIGAVSVIIIISVLLYFANVI